MRSPNKGPRRPQKALQKALQQVPRSQQGAMVVQQVSTWALWCHCRWRVMPVWSTYGVTWAGEQVQEGQTAVCTVADSKYSLYVYKNLKVGHKPPRVVPMLTNV